MTVKELMEKLSGYDIMELDCGRSTENEFWDWALSAGHYSFGLANDDLHYPDKTSKIARRCNFMYTPSATYEDIKSCLLSGCYYSMRIPDYGNGNWEEKIRKNHHLPKIENIGLHDNIIYISLSAKADSVKVFGQNHTTLHIDKDCRYASYEMQTCDSYARFTAYFPDGEVIYTNPFARYDAKVADNPIKTDTHKINIPLTILFNATLAVLLTMLVFIFYKTTFKK